MRLPSLLLIERMLMMLMISLMMACVANEPSPRRPVVVSTDCGAEVDDQWALVHLALSPEIDLKGIITTHAPSLAKPGAETSARSAREVLGWLDLPDKIPVIAGSSEPLDNGKPRETAASRFLIDAAKNFDSDHRLTIVMIGSATDVASAMLIDLSWVDRVEIVAMAFDAWPEGGDPWNVKNDVKAWQIVMASNVPLVVGDSAVTRRDLMMSPELARARLKNRGKIASDLAKTLADWLARNPKLAREVAGKPDHWPIWDEVTTAYVLGMTKQETRPRPLLKDDRSLEHLPTVRKITWITSIDSEKLWADLAKKLP